MMEIMHRWTSSMSLFYCTGLLAITRSVIRYMRAGSQALQRCQVYAHVWQCHDTLTIDGDIGSASSARVLTLFISAYKYLVTLLSVSPQVHGVSIPASDSRSHLHNHHVLDSVAEIETTAARPTLSNGTSLVRDDWHRR